MPTQTVTVTIPAGEALSNPFDCSNAIQVYLAMPEAWSHRAQLTFQYSPIQIPNWLDVFDARGEELSIPVVVSSAVRLDVDIASKGQIRLRSGTRKWPVLQEDQRMFLVTIVT